MREINKCLYFLLGKESYHWNVLLFGVSSSGEFYEGLYSNACLVKSSQVAISLTEDDWLILGCLPRLIHLLVGESEGLSESLACLKTGISINCDTLPLEFIETILNFSLCHFLLSLSTGNASGTAVGLYLNIERAFSQLCGSGWWYRSL